MDFVQKKKEMDFFFALISTEFQNRNGVLECQKWRRSYVLHVCR